MTNQLTRTRSHRVGRYAKPTRFENSIEVGVEIVRMDSPSSPVAMEANCDLQLTLMASSLCRLLAVRVGNGYESAKSPHLFRDFIDASAGTAIATGTWSSVLSSNPSPLRRIKGYSRHVAERRRFLAFPANEQ